VTDTDREELRASLMAAVAGEVRFDKMSRVLYSTDASNYQIEPLGVVFPRDADDVAAAVETCSAHSVSVIARGAGSGLAGQAIGEGVVIDCSKHMRALRLDVERRLAKAEPGVVLGELNAQARRAGLQFGPDPASADRACIGGVVGTNATGAHSILYGMTSDHLAAADVVLADGSRTRLEQRAVLRGEPQAAFTDRLYTGLLAVVDEYGDAIERHFPSYWRRAGGYNLDRLLHGVRRSGVVEAQALLAGSEGTLAVATSLELQLVDVPRSRALLVAHFDDPLDPFRAVPALLETGPSAIELVDRRLLDLARQAPGYRDDVAIVVGEPEALLIIEHSGESEAQTRAGLERAQIALRRAGMRGQTVRAVSEDEQERVWRVRKAGLGLLMSMRGDWKPVPGIEDRAVPPDALADYMAEVRALLAAMGIDAAYYAHASAGCIHVRPILDLKTAGGVEQLATLIDETLKLTLRYGGVSSSEHGDGLARSAGNRQQFGDEVYQAMRAVKEVFDPRGLMNPGKVVDAPDPTANLRYGPEYDSTAFAAAFEAHFAYPKDGDITRAIEQCNGAGVCRKLSDGAMCPSYMITLDEEHTTRARANALRAIIDGRLPIETLGEERLEEIMRLCVACKACKSECPSGVDMARLKIEVLAWRNEHLGAPLRSRLFARVHEIERWLSLAAPVANRLTDSPLWPLAAQLLNIDPRRRFPHVAQRTFDDWWRSRESQRAERNVRSTEAGRERPVVALFADTYATFQEPDIGRAAVRLLEAAGYRVVVPKRACCGRPALSQGLIDVAMRGMRANLGYLGPLARQGIPIVVPEPSCASALRDEMPDLMVGPGEADTARRIAESVFTLDEFLTQIAPRSIEFALRQSEALVHVHCHQRSHAGIEPSVGALALVPGLAVRESDAGCCGMAGAFGYQAETYDASIAMAERRLAPLVRAASPESAIIAAGASCRQQIADTTGRPAVHPAVFLAACLADTDGSDAGDTR